MSQLLTTIQFSGTEREPGPAERQWALSRPARGMGRDPEHERLQLAMLREVARAPQPGSNER